MNIEDDEHCVFVGAQSGNLGRPFITFPKCQEFFTAFFEIAPVGQNYFKQSLTRLLFIADKVLWLWGVSHTRQGNSIWVVGVPLWYAMTHNLLASWTGFDSRIWPTHPPNNCRVCVPMVFSCDVRVIACVYAVLCPVYSLYCWECPLHPESYRCPDMALLKDIGG